MIRLEYESGGVKNYGDHDASWALQELILDSHVQRMIFISPNGTEIILRKWIKDEMIRYEVKK